MPTTNLATRTIHMAPSGARPMASSPMAMRAMPTRAAPRRPKMSPSLPRTGAQAAMPMLIERVIQVTQEESRPQALTMLLGIDAVKPPARLTRAAAMAKGIKPFM